jgi:adenylate cyclase
MFDRAIERDPGYALAWAGAADAAAWASMWVERTPDNLRRADEASLKALELAPELAEALAARGFALSLNGRFAEAEVHFAKAIELDPQLFEAYYYAGRSYFAQGKFAESAEMFDKAGLVRPDDVAAACLRATARRSHGDANAAREASALAIRVIEKHLQLHPDDALAMSRGSNTLIELGETDEGLKWAEQAYALNPRVCGYNVACSYAIAGDPERALDVLEEHIRTSGVHRHWLEHDSDWDAVRGTPRFQAILGKLL